MIRAILFDQGDTLWLSIAPCGMNPAASTETAPACRQAGIEPMPQPEGWGLKLGSLDVGATFRSPAGGLKASPTFRYLVSDHEASATSGSGTLRR